MVTTAGFAGAPVAAAPQRCQELLWEISFVPRPEEGSAPGACWQIMLGAAGTRELPRAAGKGTRQGCLVFIDLGTLLPVPGQKELPRPPGGSSWEWGSQHL